MKTFAALLGIPSLPLFVFLAMVLAGCGKPASASKERVVVVAEANEVDGSDETEIELTKKLADKRRLAAARPASKAAKASKSSEAVVAQVRAPGAGEQRCFECNAQGTVACVAPGCRQGYRVCPGSCLKRSQGTWVPDKDHGGMAAVLKVPGGGTWFINEGHAGEVWVSQGGKMVSRGACPVCGGRQVIPCQVCSGGGQTPCELCETKGVIPVSWKPTDNPWFNRQPDVVRLQDGRVFQASEVGGDELLVMLKTRAGEVITIARTEVTQWPKKP